MENTLKFLSYQKDCRIVVTDGTELALASLRQFRGGIAAKTFLKELITTSVLFSGISDFAAKTSVTFKIDQELTASCTVQQEQVRIEYSPMFEKIRESPEEKLTMRSTLSVTIGDFSGLHTSAVLAQKGNVSSVFNFFAKQSDQIPAEFILSEVNPSVGFVMQPLPFADNDNLKKLKNELMACLQQSDQANGWELGRFFGDVGRQLWCKKVE